MATLGVTPCATSKNGPMAPTRATQKIGGLEGVFPGRAAKMAGEKNEPWGFSLRIFSVP